MTELGRGVRSPAQLRAELDISPQTMMRALREAGPSLLRLGHARTSRYGLRQIWPGLDTSRFPLFRIDDHGNIQSVGNLVTLAARQTAWLPRGIVATGLPIELMDARPLGFLGRHFAATHADLRLPPRLEDWSDHHVLIAMSRRGEDVPGNLIVGDESFERWQRLNPSSVTRNDYPAVAEATIAGYPPGSSAGGERPKFGVFADGRHVLVKFAARGNDPVARRWCDLLVLEDLALSVIEAHDVPTARTHLVESDSHRFLESERFDRIGARGRVAVLTLAAANSESLGDPWARAAVTLRDAGRLSDEDARRLQWLDAFGAQIANTDRHPHNILFFIEGERLRLAPAFDHVSMLYSPTADGQVPPRTFSAPLPTGDTLEVWDDARAAGREFWQRASDDPRLSNDVRGTAANNAVMMG